MTSRCPVAVINCKGIPGSKEYSDSCARVIKLPHCCNLQVKILLIQNSLFQLLFYIFVLVSHCLFEIRFPTFTC